MPGSAETFDFFDLPQINHLDDYVRYAIDQQVTTASALYVAGMFWPAHHLPEETHQGRAHLVGLGVVSWTGHLLGGIAADIPIETYRSMVHLDDDDDHGMVEPHHIAPSDNSLWDRFPLGRRLQTWLLDERYDRSHSVATFVRHAVETGIGNFAVRPRSPAFVFEASKRPGRVIDLLHNRISWARVLHLEPTSMPSGWPPYDTKFQLRPFAYAPCPEDHETWRLAMSLERFYPSIGLLYTEALATLDASPASAMARLRTMAELVARTEIRQTGRTPKSKLAEMIRQLDFILRDLAKDEQGRRLDRAAISRVSLIGAALDSLKEKGNLVHEADSVGSAQAEAAFADCAELLRTLANANPLAIAVRPPLSNPPTPPPRPAGSPPPPPRSPGSPPPPPPPPPPAR